jgi:hypothetical protein
MFKTEILAAILDELAAEKSKGVKPNQTLISRANHLLGELNLNPVNQPLDKQQQIQASLLSKLAAIKKVKEQGLIFEVGDGRRAKKSTYISNEFGFIKMKDTEPQQKTANGSTIVNHRGFCCEVSLNKYGC